jgi:tyrosine-protein phosphatase SIW14
MRNIVFGTLIALLLVAGPLGYKRWHDREHRNFYVVEEGVLYRSGQLSVERLRQVVNDHGIRTVISLREGSKPDDQHEEAWVKSSGRKFVRIQPPQWFPDNDGKIPAEASLKRFREVMEDPANYPVLVHCFAGYHRTGAMCAVFRMDYQRWTNAEAMAEMRLMGYTILDDHEDVRTYLTNYRPPQPAKLLSVTPASHKKNLDHLTPCLFPR